MVKIQAEKEPDGVWLSIDNAEWLISREAFSQLCLGLEKFDSSTDTVKEIYLDISDEDTDPYENDERPDLSHNGDAIAKRLRG